MICMYDLYACNTCIHACIHTHNIHTYMIRTNIDPYTSYVNAYMHAYMHTWLCILLGSTRLASKSALMPVSIAFRRPGIPSLCSTFVHISDQSAYVLSPRMHIDVQTICACMDTLAHTCVL
jgi:hypothetical protein